MEAAVLDSPSLISLMVSVDVKQKRKEKISRLSAEGDDEYIIADNALC